MTLGTEVNTLGSFHSSDGKWNHRFGINSQSVAFDSTQNEKETLLNSHAFEVDASHEDENVVLWFPDTDSGVIGVKPADWGSTIGTHYETAIKNTAALVNAKFAAAWSASQIIDALLDAGSKSGSGKQRRYEWSPSGDYQDLAHQGKFQVSHPDSTSISTYVNIHSNNTTWISFLLTLGTDGGNWISEIDPQTQGFSSQDNKNPDTFSRKAAKKGMERAKNAGEGLPNPENMSKKEKNKWGGQKTKRT